GIVAGDPIARCERRLLSGGRRLVTGAVAQGAEAAGPVLEILGDDVDDAFLALQAAAAIKQGGAERGAAEAFERGGPDDQIGDAGLVFEGHEDDPVGAAGTLPDQHEAGDRHAPVDRQGGEIGGRDEAFLRQLGAQKSKRMALYRQPQGRVILDDMLAERHLGQQPRREGFPCFGWITILRPSRRLLRSLLRMTIVLYAIRNLVILRSTRRVRLEGRKALLQRLLCGG